MRQPNSSTQPEIASEARAAHLQRLQIAIFRVMQSLIAPPDHDSPIIDLPILQVKCLHIIGSREGQKLGDVAQIMEVALPGVSRIVDRLVKRGLVERRPDPNDRRAMQLALTASARTALEQTYAARVANLERCTQNLDMASLDRVIEGLETLAASAEYSAGVVPSISPPLGASPEVQLLTRYPRTSHRRRESAAPGEEPVHNRE